jgi:lipopolysaccharide/colanic/teichoic acid biosynthesis glycosyltransferase
MVPSIDGEFARKRRMHSHAWPIVLRGGMLSPRGYGLIYGWMIAQPPRAALRRAGASLIALATNIALVGQGPVYVACLAAQLALLLAALAAPRSAGATAAARPLLRADAGRARRRPVGLPAPRHAGRLGSPGGHTMIRRAVDVVVATAVLLLASPLLVRSRRSRSASSRAGPAIYRQRRVGLDGREFDVLKLRTMVAGAERLGAGLAVDEGDSRITRVGALLRRTSLDELPNLWNVVRGEMSLIGPRPTVPAQVALYDERQRGRLAIKPGMTGWAQVNGRASLPWSERIELDLYYIAHRSPLLDARIVARTVAVLLGGGGGVYRGETGGWDGSGDERR